MPHPHLIITGPTAVGKTASSLQVAERLGAEIVSVDSRQIYRQIDTGTAKPSARDRERVPHHFVDELDLKESISAGEYAERAEARMKEILERGNRPLLVGGATLYLRALKEGLADIPDVPADVRDHLNERLEREGAETLYEELLEVDPEAAESMDPTKTQRLVRALEVYHGTGRALTFYHENQPEPEFSYVTVVLNRDRKKIHRRISRRVDHMLDEGLLEEVRRLREKGYTPDNTQALRSIGYREPMAYLSGEFDYEEMVRLLKRNTRRYAKRQITWFRRDESNRWIHIQEANDPSDIAREILDIYVG